MDNMDNVGSLYRGLFRNGAIYGMCCYNPIFDKTILGRFIYNNEISRDNMEYIDLKFEDIKLCTKVYKELGREKFIKLYEEYIKNVNKSTNQSQEAKTDNG